MDPLFWLAIIGMPGSILVGGGSAWLLAQHRGEFRPLDTDDIIAELRRQH